MFRSLPGNFNPPAYNKPLISRAEAALKLREFGLTLIREEGVDHVNVAWCDGEGTHEPHTITTIYVKQEMDTAHMQAFGTLTKLIAPISEGFKTYHNVSVEFQSLNLGDDQHKVFGYVIYG